MVRAYPLRLAVLALMALCSGCGGSGEPFQAGDVRLLPGVGEVTRFAAAPAAGRILLISEETLFAVSPEGEMGGELELPAAPCGLAVRGQRAAVSHAGYLTLIDLENLVIERILEVRAPCAEVALAEEDAYLLPKSLGRNPVIQVPLSGQRPQSTEAEHFSSGCRLALHPSGEKIYVACDESVGRIGLDAQGRVDKRKSFETRVYMEPGCNGIWISTDGDWVYAACGGRFRSNDVLPTHRVEDEIYVSDLSPAGELPMEGISSLCEVDGVLAVVPAQFSSHRVYYGLESEKLRLLDEEGGRSIEFFSHPRLQKLESVPLPDFPTGGAARGYAVFCDLSPGEVHVLAKEDEAGRWGLLRIPIPEL